MAKAPAVFSKAKCAITGKGCFVAGTIVATIYGGKAIEDIEVGDKVLASDPETGETAYKEVLNTFIYVKDTLVYVTVNGETIETTKEHPFWVEWQGWTKAKFLEAGDQLRDASGNTVAIDNVEIVPLPENQYTLVYNFEVADFHTYYVADSYVLVHNICDSTILGQNMMADMGLPKSTKWTGYQAQHIIPCQLKNHPAIKKIGMNINDASNGIFLRIPDSGISTLSRHRGFHSPYNSFVKSQLDKLDLTLSVSDLKKEVNTLQSNLRKLQEKGLPLYSGKKNGTEAAIDLWEWSYSKL